MLTMYVPGLASSVFNAELFDSDGLNRLNSP